MRKTFVLVALAALTVPANAAAKEISAAKVCGASACVTTTDKAALMQMTQSSTPLATRPPAPTSYYEITLEVSEPDHGVVGSWNAWFVPTAGTLSTRGESGSPEWSSIGSESVDFLKTTAANLEPFPTPTFTRVLLGRRAVRDPNSYRGLFDPSWPLVATSASDWKPITIFASAANPWTDGSHLLYSPRKNVLWRGAERLRVPAQIAANIEARRSLLAPAKSGNAAWAWAAGGAAAAAAVAGVAVRSRRRSV